LLSCLFHTEALQSARPAVQCLDMHSIRTWFGRSTPTGLILLGFMVGIGGALGAALFHLLIALTTYTFYGLGSGSPSFINILEAMPAWQRVLIPTLGGLLVGIIYKVSKVNEAEGEGVPEVMEALAHKNGTIRPIVAPVKIITAALTLGSGGSAGREGPVIQIGSTIGSSIAQYFKQATSERRFLLDAGAAAAIGGTFGAPIAGVLFTVEILGNRPNVFRAIVLALSAFTGAIGAKIITGHTGLRFITENTFSIDMITVVSLLILSITAAVVAVSFGSVLNLGRIVFKKISLPHVLKPAIGGFGIGVIGLFIPYIHEPAAYPLMIDLISLTTLPLSLLAILLVIKILATSITLGSGGSGGIFAPLLLMGAILGSILGGLLVLTSFSTTLIVPTLIFVGMATVFAAAAHAPLTAAFITYEMTENIYLLIPLLITCFIATIIAKKINPRSVYHHNT
jgi:chloride channel protein, CIC family